MTQLPAAWSIVIALLAIVITKLWDPVAEYLGYPFDVRRCVNDLGDAIERLHDMKDELLLLDPRPLSGQHLGWLRRVNNLIGKAERIKAGLNCFTWCYSGKEAGKELKKAEDLASEGKDLVKDARERPRPVRDAHPQERLWGMDSYKQMVFDFVNDEEHNSRLLGIWGMGGVGKSRLLQYSSSEHNHSFHPVLFVQAGRGCTVGKLQNTIASDIGLPMISNETSQGAIIFNLLRDRYFLLLLDDLWDYLDLEAIGVPMSLHRGKVIFTTRSLDVCAQMRCRENTIRMGCLGEDDAWNLFADKVGDKIVNDVRIHPHAKEIVEECSGLPMALCMIGQHMSDKKDHREWRTAKELWKKSKLHETTVTPENSFKRLQESYDNLTADMKERFLLCSLWPENENISKKKLIRWWTGLGLLDEVSNASDTGYSFINDLVRLSILEKCDTGLDFTENSHIKIHSMTRKMALWIVNEHGDIRWLSNSSYRSALVKEKWNKVEKAWVSEEDTLSWCRWSSTVCFPRLRMLVSQHVFSLDLIILYFQKITFLDLEGTKRDRFPFEICRLTGLQHLNLSATTIDVLPPELKKLSELKYLHIRNNMGLQKIPEGLMLDLKRLRGLDLFCTGASFPSILEDLKRSGTGLDMLGFTVQTAEEMTKLGQLKGVCTQALCMHHFEDDKHLATVNLQLLSIPEQLRELSIKKSSHIEALIAEGGCTDDQWLLPYLEIFELNNLLNLEKVTWRNAGMDIRVVSIYKCDKLKDVTWVHHLELLEQLTVANCQEMERLVETGESPQGEIMEDLPNVNQMVAISFPSLKNIKLEDLPKLSIISKQACEFERLSYISVTRCDNIKDIRNHKYKQSMVTINCSEDWWNGDNLGFIPNLVPTFCS